MCCLSYHELIFYTVIIKSVFSITNLLICDNPHRDKNNDDGNDIMRIEIMMMIRMMMMTTMMIMMMMILMMLMLKMTIMMMTNIFTVVKIFSNFLSMFDL